MRLSDFEKEAIIKIFSDFYVNKELEIYLYGSRALDNLKGGDIDLLWVASDLEADNLNSNKYRILSRLKGIIGEQKIDLSIITKDELKSDPFFAGVFERAVRLS